LRALAGPDVDVAGPGDWGPWVNGGAWLRVEGVAVDWILRGLDRVEQVWADCREMEELIATVAGARALVEESRAALKGSTG
jgi:hypothetical protein